MLLPRIAHRAVPRRFQHTCAVPTAGHSLLSNKSLVSVKGVDATKFLNGLVTYKMLPSFVKKNEMTISTQKDDESLSVHDFNLNNTNWGSIKESIETRNLTVDRNGFFTSILNSKGRIISDVFIYSFEYVPDVIDNEEPHYLVEIHNDLVKTILGLFKMHKLKARVSFKIRDDLKVWYAFNNEKQDLTYEMQMSYFNPESKELKTPEKALEATHEFLKDTRLFQTNIQPHQVLGFAFDERCPDFGIKVITSSTTERLSEVLTSAYLPQSAPLPISVLDKRRYSTGIPESPTELTPNKYLPLESCFEYMGGINFDKGCYIGQELTVRTYHTGIVRKRVVPIKLYPIDKDPETIELDSIYELQGELTEVLESLEIYSDKEDEPKKQLASSPFGGAGGGSKRPSRRTSSGTLLKCNGSLGLALVRLEDFATEGRFHVEVPRGGSEPLKVGVKAFIPHWWPEE